MTHTNLHIHPGLHAALASIAPRTAPGAVLPVVWVTEGEQYGAKVYKPHCHIAAGLAAIARQKTITPYTLMHMKSMGFTVRVVGRPEVEL